MTERDHPSQHLPSELPAELRAALSGEAYACLTVATEAGTALLLKAPRIEIAAVRGLVPVRLGHELYTPPCAAVIRLALRIYDRPQAPLAMETFINVADPQQRADYAALAQQEAITLLFLDETLQPRLTKQISHSSRAVVAPLLAAAERHQATIAVADFDFERAKQQVMATTQL